MFKIVLKWIEQNKSERKASFDQLFRHVRLPFLSRDFLVDVVTNEFVEGNFDCLKLISKALKLTGFSSKENLSQSPRRGLETRAIVACGGKYTLCYLLEKDEWKRLADGLTERNQGSKMMSYRDELYVFPPSAKAERYDPAFNSWSTLDLQLSGTTRSAEVQVAIVRGEIYAIDINTSTKKTTIKRYNIERCLQEYPTTVSKKIHRTVCLTLPECRYVNLV